MGKEIVTHPRQGHVTNHPTRVSLSRPRLCNFKYRYMTVRYTYRGRTTKATFDYICN
jgi:hypothetical protein